MRQAPLKSNYLTTRLLSHRQRVCALYKKSLLHLRSYYYQDTDFRYHQAILRERFDRHRNEVDMRKSKVLVQQGERELFRNEHYKPMVYPDSPGGAAYDRERYMQDWIVDSWHPWEKAQYPDYFTRREERKTEYVELWKKWYNQGQEWDSHETEYHGNWEGKMNSKTIDLPPLDTREKQRPGINAPRIDADVKALPTDKA